MTEHVTRGAAGDPEADVAEALGGLVADFAAFKARIDDRMTKQDERLTMTYAPARRPTLAAAEIEAPHLKAMGAYLRSGDDDALRGLAPEAKGLTTQVAGDGGFLVAPETSTVVAASLESAASLRSLATVVAVEAGTYDVLLDDRAPEAGWADETGTVAETEGPAFRRVSIPLHELAAQPKASQRLLDDAAFDVEGWLAARIAETFARSEAHAFLQGDGVLKPRGVLTYPTADTKEGTTTEIGAIRTGTAGGFDPVKPLDAVIDLVYALGARYRANATFVLNSKTAGELRRLKDAEGRFLWVDGIQKGEPAQLLGYPVLVSEDMPDIKEGAAAILFGDFRAGYTVAERPDLRVLRDPFSAKPHVLFYATKRVGGDVTDMAAIKALVFGA